MKKRADESREKEREFLEVQSNGNKDRRGKNSDDAYVISM